MWEKILKNIIFYINYKYLSNKKKIVTFKVKNNFYQDTPHYINKIFTCIITWRVH